MILVRFGLGLSGVWGSVCNRMAAIGVAVPREIDSQAFNRICSTLSISNLNELAFCQV